MGSLNIYSDRSIESTLIEINGEELENLYELFVKYEQGKLYAKITVLDGKKRTTHDIVPSIYESNGDENNSLTKMSILSIENTSNGICVKHNGVLLSDLVKLYVHIKAKMTNYYPNISENVTDGTELFEAFYFTEISENRSNIIHIF